MMADDNGSMTKNRSMLKDFLASIITMTGDLSNITAPPFLLDTRSVVEIPSFFAENPAIFVSSAMSDDPAQRSLLVLRSFLSGLKSQCYMGHKPEEGVKKPLNAFLGELFVGKWEDENGTTHMLSEQVSHHPPITACRVWNDKHGVIAEGYNLQKVTFDGSVNVQCFGHIVKSLTKYDEHYLMPIPDFKVKGVLSTPYPETSGTYYIPATNGYTSVIHFSAKGLFSGNSKKHEFTAHLFKEEDGETNPLYTVQGHWDTEFTIRDNTKGKEVEVFHVEDQTQQNTPHMIMDPIDQQDPWESRNAWKDVVAALKSGDMKAVTDAKNHLEQGQRDMREKEKNESKQWTPLFFKSFDNDAVVEQLNAKLPGEDYRKSKDRTEGVWKFDLDAWKRIKKPYHGSLRPDNTAVQLQARMDKSSKEVQDPNSAGSIQDSQNSTQSPPPKQQQQPAHSNHDEIDHTIGAVEDGRPVHINGVLVDVGRQPEPRAIEGITKEQPGPQVAQMDVVHEHQGTGITGMSVEEKEQIENMLRDEYSVASRDKSALKAKRRSGSG